MLAALTRAQATFITESNPREAFEQLLELLLSITASEYGFIGEVLRDDDDNPYLKTYAITDISWDASTRLFFAENVPAGLEFVNKNSLFGHVMTSGKPVITNTPSSDPRSAGIPAGHPPLNAFLGLPFFLKDDLLGMVGVANREGGYDEEIAKFLEPLLSTCAHLIHGRRLEQEREQSREREAQLIQSLENAHRAEALGRLAGGIAHDFNNLLSVIGCSAELIFAATNDPTVASDSEAIIHATDRGALLASQLLSFAKSGEFNPAVTAFNTHVGDGLRMLRRLLGSDIELVATFDETVGSVWMDPVRLEHVIVNLGVNARDAMPNGGKLHVATRLVQEKSQAFAQLTMADDGMGMDASTQTKIFDPFFTTKAPGKGTGLGLAMCQGAVQSANGTIRVESTAGEGTIFIVQVPIHQGAVKTPATQEPTQHVAPTPVSILLAEDEPRLREVAERILKAAGHDVVSAGDGFEAERLATSHPGGFQLLLTDMIMPGIGGFELAQRLRTSIPNIIFMSGYMGALDASEVASSWPVLSKPFTSQQLLAKIAESIPVARSSDDNTAP